MEVHMNFIGNRMESVGGYEDAGWTRCISKGTASLRATIRQLDTRSQKRILTGENWKASLELEQLFGVLQSAEETEIARCIFKGERRPGRPYDSGTDPDTNSDRESLES